jgi:uncharacterized protein YggE
MKKDDEGHRFWFVYGPLPFVIVFSLIQILFGSKDAREKATLIAKASGRKLGKVVTVNDGGTVSNIYPMYRSIKAADGMGGGAVSEPGSATVSKSMTVVFEFN